MFACCAAPKKGGAKPGKAPKKKHHGKAPSTVPSSPTVLVPLEPPPTNADPNDLEGRHDEAKVIAEFRLLSNKQVEKALRAWGLDDAECRGRRKFERPALVARLTQPDFVARLDSARKNQSTAPRLSEQWPGGSTTDPLVGFRRISLYNMRHGMKAIIMTAEESASRACPDPREVHARTRWERPRQLVAMKSDLEQYPALYYQKPSGGQSDVVPLEQAIELIIAGEINASTRVWAAGMADWLAIEECCGHFAGFAEVLGVARPSPR